MSIYVGQNYVQPTAHLARYSMRLDGFASVSAPYEEGEMLTKPILVTGKQLVLNNSTSANGSIYVEIQTADGEPIPGYTLRECKLYRLSDCNLRSYQSSTAICIGHRDLVGSCH